MKNRVMPTVAAAAALVVLGVWIGPSAATTSSSAADTATAAERAGKASRTSREPK
jgi:hypothetical protein